MKFIKNKDVLSREESEGFSLFNPENGELHKLNKHAFFIFTILENEMNMVEIESEVRAKFAIKEDQNLQQLLLGFLNELNSKNLIKELN